MKKILFSFAALILISSGLSLIAAEEKIYKKTAYSAEEALAIAKKITQNSQNQLASSTSQVTPESKTKVAENLVKAISLNK